MHEDTVTEEHTPAPLEPSETPAERGATGSSRRAARPVRRARAATGANARTVAYVAIGLVAVLIALVALDVAVSWDRIHPGVRVAGVDVGLLTPAAATARLTDVFSKEAAKPVSLQVGEETWKVGLADVGGSFDVTSTVRGAMAVGRTGGAWQVIAERAAALFAGGAEADVVIDWDSELMAALLDRADSAVGVAARDAAVTVTGTKVAFAKSAPGTAVDRERTIVDLVAGFAGVPDQAKVFTVASLPRVADADAQQSYVDAQKLVDGPVTIAFEEKTLEVPVAKVASWIRFDAVPVVTQAVDLAAPSAPTTADAEASATAEPQRLMLVASFDTTRVGESIAPLTKGLGAPARDAGFVFENGKVTVTPSKTGTGADVQRLARELASACVSGSERRAEVVLVEIQPSLTTEAAKQMGISDRISSYTTYYPSSATSRVHNIHLLADAFNGKLVPPGGTFSFNGTAGKRTAEKGYQEAPAIVNGKLVPQLGGGVCQVGTTFFNSVFFAGLPVVERHNHSFYISHYPKGRDATVSWGGPDFKFKNDTDGWLLIRTSYTSSSLTIALYGTDPGYKVEYTTSQFTDVVPFKTTEIDDPKLPIGARVVEEGGVRGGRVTVVRTVYKDGQVVREDTFVSRYTPKAEVVRVGTKVSTTPTSTPTP